MPHVLVVGLPIPFFQQVRKEDRRGLGLAIGNPYQPLNNGRETPIAERAPGLPVRVGLEEGTKVRPRCIASL